MSNLSNDACWLFLFAESSLLFEDSSESECIEKRSIVHGSFIVLFSIVYQSISEKYGCSLISLYASKGFFDFIPILFSGR